MTVRRVMPVHTVPDLEAARAYGAVLGLREVMNLGWIVTLADDELRHQISLMTRDKTAPVNPNVSIEVDDVDDAYDAAVDAGLRIVHPLSDEEWGVRRFFFADAAGNVVNVLTHQGRSLTAESTAATCIRVGVYAHALTYGAEYEVLNHDADKGQVQVRGDNGKKRWFPTYCFDMTGQPVVRLVRTTIDDPLDSPSVDVVLEFSDGHQRWCYFTTPEVLSQLGGHAQFDGERLLSFGSRHMVVVSSITRAMIEQSLAYIESQGELVDCSRPVD